MDTFSTRILSSIESRGLSFPGLDQEAILDQIVPIAEEYIMMQMVTHDLSADDQVLWWDSYLSGPDVFDPVEFLIDSIPEFDARVDHYFDLWLSDFTWQL
jgi:hypothetical protein